MECRQVRRMLPALLDGELSPQASDEVQAHLRGCPGCRRRYDQYRQDQAALSQHLRVAPWLPFEQRPWEHGERAPRRGFWEAMLAGGHKLGAAAALLALLALVTAGGLALRHMGTSGQTGLPGNNLPTVAVGAASPVGATPAGLTNLQDARRDYYARVFTPLRSHGLVYDINRQVAVGGSELTVGRLAVDRGATYLEYTAPIGEQIPGKWSLRSAGGAVVFGPMPIAAPPADPTTPVSSGSNWLELPALDPDTQEVTLTITPDTGDPIDIPVALDLAAIRALPAPEPLSASVKVNGITVEARSLTRGVAVSTLDWVANVADRGALARATRSFDEENTLPWSAEANDAPVDVAGGRGGGNNAGWRFTTRFIALPSQGTLSFSIDWLAIDGNGSATNVTYRGPWTLTVDLGADGPTTPVPSSTPTATPRATQTPIATPRAESPTGTPAVTPTLTADLYFLAQTPSGLTGIWVQPADGGKPRLVVQNADSDVEAFWVMPSIKTIAYRLADDPQAILFNLGTGQTVKATTLDVKTTPPAEVAATEYAFSTDDSKLASIPVDRQSVVVTTIGADAQTRVGAIRVDASPAETFHLVRWSPDGSSLGFEAAKIAGNSLVRIVSAKTLQTVWQASRPALTWDWSPDSTSIIYASYGRIAKVNLATGQETDLTPERLTGTNQAILNMHWLRDGRIAFVVHDDPTVYSPAWIWLMNADGSEAWRAREIGPADDVIWTPAPGRDGFVGFIVGTIDDGTAPKPGASLTWYPTLHDDPVPLAPDIVSRQFGSLRWGS